MNVEKVELKKTQPKRTRTSKILTLPDSETELSVKTAPPVKTSQSKTDLQAHELRQPHEQSSNQNPGQVVKNALQAAFEGMGGVQALTEWAAANPKEFYQLYIKLLALQPKTDTSGDLIIQWQK